MYNIIMCNITKWISILFTSGCHAWCYSVTDFIIPIINPKIKTLNPMNLDLKKVQDISKRPKWYESCYIYCPETHVFTYIYLRNESSFRSVNARVFVSVRLVLISDSHFSMIFPCVPLGMYHYYLFN